MHAMQPTHAHTQIISVSMKTTNVHTPQRTRTHTHTLTKHVIRHAYINVHLRVISARRQESYDVSQNVYGACSALSFKMQADYMLPSVQ